MQEIVARLPECERVDIEAWGDEATFRVHGKNFVFTNQSADHVTLKLSREEAAAVVATEANAAPAGYGLGRHGWVALALHDDMDGDAWAQVEEWVRTSYTLVAPRRLARLVLEQDGTA